jgi:hypothetical protein
MTSDTLQAVIGEKILAVKQRFSERVINIELEVRFNVTAELFFGSFQDVCSFAHVFPRYEQTIVCVDNSDSRRMRSEYTATQPPIFIQSTAKLRLMPSTDLPTKFGNMRVDVQEETVTQDLVAMGNFFRMREVHVGDVRLPRLENLLHARDQQPGHTCTGFRD